MNFDNYLFRASAAYNLCAGNIGITIDQEKRIEELLSEQKTGINANGNKCKFTPTKVKELAKLQREKENPTLPKTMQTELRKIYRSVKFNRKFLFTNKYIKKGISQEEESFSTYQKWLEEFSGIKFPLLNNHERINGKYFTGETDVNKHFYQKFGWGFDIKTPWSLETFPFEDDDLDIQYKWQNLIYMELTGIKEWKTVFVLVNSTESALHNEKMKYFYAYDIDKSDIYEKQYKETIKDLERLHIVDYDRFVYLYPSHDLEISREEWFGNDWDIPLKDRVIEKVVKFDQSKIDFINERAVIGRKYLNQLGSN